MHISEIENIRKQITSMVHELHFINDLFKVLLHFVLGGYLLVFAYPEIT